MKKLLLFLLIPLALAISCSTPSEKTSETAELPILGERYVDDNQDTVYHSIADFAFVNQLGDTIRKEDMAGKVYVADFFFTTCKSICPRLTKNLGELQRRFNTNPNILFVSHSVLPDEDSVAVLKRYAQRNNIPSNQWHLLTGNRDSIYRLARREYFAGDSVGYFQAGNEFLHTENFILLDRHRRIRGVYNGTLPVEVDRLEEDIRTLLQERN